MRHSIMGFLAAALLWAAGAPAATQLAVEVGWNGIYRYGRWTPVYLTAFDPGAKSARNVRLEIFAPHESASSLRIGQLLVLRPEPTTFLVYLPLTENLADSVAVLRDAETGDRLAAQSFAPTDLSFDPRLAMPSVARDLEEVVIGICGQRSSLDSAPEWLKWEWQLPTGQGGQADSLQTTVRTGRIGAERLPDMPLGYDGLDLLVLSAPELGGLRPECRQAIAAWVRGGGRILVWMRDGLVAPGNEIADLLPCEIGALETIRLTVEEAKSLGLTPQVEHLGGRVLQPRPGARKHDLMDGRASLWQRESGFGLAAILSIDASQLIFSSSDNSRKFWDGILRNLLPSIAPEQRRTASAFGTLEDAQRSASLETVVNRLGDIPGVGRFDFSYIALVMIAMMLVVGPVDWFVLRKLGRQPWTWATTTGWIALVTVGALYVGHVVRSGDLHFRTLRRVDQADGQVVASLDVAAIYSPRTGSYALQCPPQSWWQPAEVVSPFRRNRSTLPEVRMAQDLQGNRPLPMNINIWNLRFLIGDFSDFRSEGPALQATLRFEPEPGGKGGNIVGALTNRSAATLYEIRLLCGDGGAILREAEVAAESARTPGQAAGIKPGETAQVNVPLRPAREVLGVVDRDRLAEQWYAPSRAYEEGPVPFLRAAADLRVQRSRRVTEVLPLRRDQACILAEGVLPEGRTRLADGGTALQRHWLVIRAMVPLEGLPASTPPASREAP